MDHFDRALDDTGAPRVAYSDVTGIWLAERATDGTWAVEEIVTAGDRPLGPLVSMQIDETGATHPAFFEVTANDPLSGLVAYVAEGA